MSGNIQETVSASADCTVQGEKREEDSNNAAKAYYASQLDEYARISKMYKFVRSKDAPNESVRSILDIMLENPPVKENTVFVCTDIIDIAM